MQRFKDGLVINRDTDNNNLVNKNKDSDYGDNRNIFREILMMNTSYSSQKPKGRVDIKQKEKE